ncbi:MAG: nucleoid occlusion protein [Bacillota bacterium]|nr:nucleoid occlusion protein [Bacillota bacterium]
MNKSLEKILGKGVIGKIIEIPLDDIVRNPYQPRVEFDQKELKELADSIVAYGVIQPIIVRRATEGFQLIAGERRFRACKLIGNKNIPAIIQDMDDEQAAGVSLIENLQRKELNYFEEASAYLVLINEFGMTQDELAKKVGKSQSTIANKLRLLKLPDEVRSMMLGEFITERHARALLKLESVEVQKQVLQKVYDEGLNVKDTEELVERFKENNLPGSAQKRGRGQNVSMIIRDARIFLNTIKETVNRARQTGIDMTMTETEDDDTYQVTISIPKIRQGSRKSG